MISSSTLCSPMVKTALKVKTLHPRSRIFFSGSHITGKQPPPPYASAFSQKVKVIPRITASRARSYRMDRIVNGLRVPEEQMETPEETGSAPKPSYEVSRLLSDSPPRGETVHILFLFFFFRAPFSNFIPLVIFFLSFLDLLAKAKSSTWANDPSGRLALGAPPCTQLWKFLHPRPHSLASVRGGEAGR